MPILEIDDVSVTYGSTRRLARRIGTSHVAVDHVSLQVERGQIVGVVGESGSGKSSLAKAVVGLVEPTSGEIRLSGQVIPSKRPRAVRRRMQMVFQDPSSALNPALTVGKVIVELLEIDGMGRSAARSRAVDLIDMVGLPASALDVRPGSLSGGQRQRASIARALATNPEVIVADEPTSALDVSVQATVLNLLRDFTESLGLGVLFITHDLGVVRRLCDDVAVMQKGCIVEHGRTTSIFDSPADSYTKQLLASIPTIG
ncbi:ABC transporter ATP-binding protein [Streptomyces malaysiensis]|uniref:ATP-binding cassette domain-containing protein n=1 Tax=Streptomyces malaysiensis subsp. samsunensis TaxID=459658 RepID=A0A9X2LWJ6_STRMQ|nr:ATP-binding cassette domain-containing protein [Streptomyces samsunensis]MCQ8831271.1 ATP-binding cassette domain-containing protein [Streptomyces samsunensis]WPB90707.1 ATP-binding cassette domain-containing protein [Streptomyces malaysiensis]